jgi:hypothetical protein
VGAFGGELEAGDLRGEVGCPGVEVLDAGGAQAVGCGVVLHHPHLRQRVGDWGGGGEGDDLGAVLLAQPLQPDVELAGVPGAGLAERWESGGDGEVLGVVGFVDEEVVDAGLFEGGAVVLVGAVQQCALAFLQFEDPQLDVFNGAGAPADAAFEVGGRGS